MVVNIRRLLLNRKQLNIVQLLDKKVFEDIYKILSRNQITKHGLYDVLARGLAECLRLVLKQQQLALFFFFF